MLDVEITLPGGGGGFAGFGFLFGVGRVYVLMTVFYIFWAGEQMDVDILTARASLSVTTDRRLSCDL